MTGPVTPFSADERDRLEQELLELHFGCHEDPAALQARLAGDPTLQALQREVLAKAVLLEEAAKPELPQLELSTAPPAPRRFRLLRSVNGRLALAGTLAAVVMLGFFLFVAWFWVFIVVLSDIFRHEDMSGGTKALWVLFVIVIPWLGVLIYIIVNGAGLSDRRLRA